MWDANKKKWENGVRCVTTKKESQFGGQGIMVQWIEMRESEENGKSVKDEANNFCLTKYEGKSGFHTANQWHFCRH